MGTSWWAANGPILSQVPPPSAARTRRRSTSISTRVLDAHCERARAAGAEIIREPEDEFYGDRTYMAKDPEGHVWSFAQNLRYVSREEAEKASGLKIEGWV